MHKLPQSTLTLLEPFCFEGSNGHVRGTSGITNAPHTTAGALKLEPVMIGASTNDQHWTTRVSTIGSTQQPYPIDLMPAMQSLAYRSA